jgi:uncharacterized membrane protein
MVIMAIDHAGNVFDAHHMHGDTASGWVPGSPLPADEFLTRWITHLCAPVFVVLAGTSLALSSEKRRDEPGQTAFLIKRGLLIAVLDPLWMTLAFVQYRFVLLQVLYAIGLSMVLMAWLRRLPTRLLASLGLAIAALGELAARIEPHGEPWRGAWRLLWTAGPVGGPALICGYPLLPWLSMMIGGWVLGRWLLADRARPAASRALPLAAAGALLLAVFGVVRGLDGYGNWGLHRDSLAPLQWLHVAKYPPSLAFVTLELGLGLLLLAALFAVDDGRPRPLLAPLAVLGSTAFFFYVLHAHLMLLVGVALGVDRATHGIAKTYAGAAGVVLALYPLCVRYRRYKAAHPDGWTRYL